jgi:signal transduction histidine kinase
MDSQPEGVRDALTVIEATGRHALAEMRRMLGVLRSDAAAPAYDERAPAPGLEDLTVLAEHAAQAEVRVDLDILGAHHLPDWVTLAAYRIVQEALTNVVKHAAPTTCQVRVACTARDLRIDVTDAGGHRGTRTPTAGGHGLIGMRERVALLGGEFQAGAAPGGGFRVSARLPLESTSLVAAGPEVLADRPPTR